MRLKPEQEKRKKKKEDSIPVMKDLTSENHGRCTTIHVKSGKCLTEDQEILSR